MPRTQTCREFDTETSLYYFRARQQHAPGNDAPS
jgi:hypothetical protein